MKTKVEDKVKLKFKRKNVGYFEVWMHSETGGLVGKVGCLRIHYTWVWVYDSTGCSLLLDADNMDVIAKALHSLNIQSGNKVPKGHECLAHLE